MFFNHALELEDKSKRTVTYDICKRHFSKKKFRGDGKEEYFVMIGVTLMGELTTKWGRSCAWETEDSRRDLDLPPTHTQAAELPSPFPPPAVSVVDEHASFLLSLPSFLLYV